MTFPDLKNLKMLLTIVGKGHVILV